MVSVTTPGYAKGLRLRSPYPGSPYTDWLWTNAVHGLVVDEAAGALVSVESAASVGRDASLAVVQ
eukprot:758246-Pleurochrysis_carterae.AAC.1